MLTQTVFIGYFYLFLVVVIWVWSGFLIQWIFSESSNGYTNNPIAMTILSVGLCCLLLLLPRKQADDSRQRLIKKNRTRLLTSKSLLLGSVWLLAQLLYNLSLKNLSVSASSSISAFSSLFTYLFSLLLLTGYTIDINPLLGILFSITGIHLLVNAPDNQVSILGIFLAVTSCAFYGLFSVLLKKWSTDSVVFLFGQLGLVAIILGVPILVLAHVSGIETFKVPSISCFCAISVNALFGSVLSDILLANAILRLTPILVSVGLTFTIPVSAMIESPAHFPTVRSVLGYAFVVTSLVLVGRYNPSE